MRSPVAAVVVAGSAWLLSGVLVSAGGAPSQSNYCKPGQLCWPALHAWSTLNATIGGQLIEVTPVAKPCYVDPTGVGCEIVEEG
ncbi:hypothetical protein HK100_008685, partial [Physocladia obscura]